MSVKVFHKQTDVKIIKCRSLTQVFECEKKNPYNSNTIKMYNMLKKIPPRPRRNVIKNPPALTSVPKHLINQKGYIFKFLCYNSIQVKLLLNKINDG